MTHSEKLYLEEWRRVDDVRKCDPVEDNVRTHSGNTESAKLLKSGCKDVIFELEQPGDTPSSPKASWQAVENRKLSGTQGTSAFWEISGAPLLPRKTRVQLYSPKAGWSLSRSSETAESRRRDIIRLRGRRLVHARWFYYVGDSRLQHCFGTARGRQ